MSELKKVTRIRYKRQEDGTLYSNPMLAGGILIIIMLNAEQMKFKVKNYDTKEDIVSGSATSITLLKLAAKNAAKETGVVFFDEVRSKKAIEQVTKETPNV